MTTYWESGSLTGQIGDVILDEIKIYKIEINETGDKAFCFFIWNNISCIMYNTDFLNNPTDSSKWTIYYLYVQKKIKSCTSWTSPNNYFYMYYCFENYESSVINYVVINPNDSSVLFKNIEFESPHVYNDISISHDGKYLCVVAEDTLVTLYCDEYIVENKSDLFDKKNTNKITDAKYISASNNDYTSFILITSDDELCFIYNFEGSSSYVKVILDDSNTYSLLSNLSSSNTSLEFSFYSTSNSKLYEISVIGEKNSGVYSFISKTITKISEVGTNTFSCLKSNSIITSNTTTNSIFTSSTNIYTYNNSTYYVDDITGTDFIYCALSGLDGSIPYMVSAVNNTNTIFYSLSGGACFIEKTKITIFENCKEVQKNIEYLKKGDLVKNSFGNYKKISYIGYNKINVLKNLNHIMVMDENTLNSNEKLFLTSGHSVLFDNYENINEYYVHDVYKNNILNCCKIMTQHCKLFRYANLNDIEHLNKNNFVNYYHIVLENENLDGQYGVYANNVLCETMSFNFIPKSGLLEHNKNERLNIKNVKGMRLIR